MVSLPLHEYRVQKWTTLIHRTHTILHSIALTAMIYYRISSFLNYHTNKIAIVPWVVILASELLLAFIWILSSAYLWRPISRTVYPERLPHDSELPAIDVFICTADHRTEPPLGVMNTVISAMALDYPFDKLSVYLSDDGSSSLTLYAIREAWKFAKCWVPFCRSYNIKTRCPEVYFLALDDHDHIGNDYQEFEVERNAIEREYKEFKDRLRVATAEDEIKNTAAAKNSKIHSPNIQVIASGFHEMPNLVYVSREKNPSYPHHFKAGALNVLLRVSEKLSNSPYILVLDCDMYSNDSSSARQAMCFHLDKNISPSLAFVQFPQNFHNISKNDIYGAALRTVFGIRWPGMDGLQGPMLSGTGFYMKRKALDGSDNSEADPGISRGAVIDLDIFLKEAKVVSSCAHENDTQWGKQIGFLYESVLEDYFTGFILHCRGWNSIFYDPLKPAFVGSATTNLSDTLVQGIRWNFGAFQVFLSQYCPLIYGLSRMPLLECMCYAYLPLQALYCFPVWCLAIVPQLYLLRGIPVFPKVSSPWFIIYSFVFISPLAINLWDVLRTGGTLRAWWNEWRVWMIKSITSYFYGTLEAILKLIGITEAKFTPTNKVADDEQLKRYQMDIFDFQAPMMLIAPLATLVLLNMVSFILGTALVTFRGLWKELFAQIFLSLFIVIVSYPIIEGMLFRKDKGRIALNVTLLSAAATFTILSLNASIYIRS